MAQQRASGFIRRLIFFSIASQIMSAAGVAFAQRTVLSQPPVFLPPVAYDSGGIRSFAIAVSDLNGDGKLDLVVTNQCISQEDCPDPEFSMGHGTVGVLLGNGDGTFQPVVTYDAGGNHFITIESFSVAAGDLNGDSKPDLVVANSGGFCQNRTDCPEGSVGVLFGNGDGSFQSPWTYSSYGFAPVSTALGDVNGDGGLDVIVANICYIKPTCGISGCECEKGSVGVLLNDGSGLFHSVGTYGSGGPWARSVAVEDVNGDGTLDVVVANAGGVGVLLGNGDGTFQSALTYGAGGELNSVAVGDVNGDGKLDLAVTPRQVCSTCANGEVAMMLGNGDGTFQPPVTYGSGGQYASSVAIGDVNRDGKPDLVLTHQFGPNFDDRAVGVLPGNGDGTFRPPVMFSSGGHWPYSVVLADLNGDSKLDLGAANFYGPNGGAVGVLLNHTPFCTTKPTITLSATPRSLWPPNGKLVPVTVTGKIAHPGNACTITSLVYAVKDEYDEVQPSGPVILGPEGTYSFSVPLQASRLGTDIDGRLYTVTVTAMNNGGQTGSQAGAVIVPHDQGH
jgi:uncharacterized protein (DUF2141 family)